MPENNIENLKNQMEELSLNLAKSVEELDKIIKEQSTIAKQNVIKSQADFLNQLQSGSLKIPAKQVDYLEKQQILTDMNQPQTMEAKDLEEETKHVIQVLQEQRNAVFESNLQQMNLSIEKKEEQVIEETLKSTSAKTAISKLEKKLKKNIGAVKMDLEVGKSKSIKPGANVKNKRKKKNPEWNQSLAYFKCALGASAILGMVAVPVIGETLNHLPPKEKVGVESEFSLDKSAEEAKSNVLSEYQDEIFEPNTIYNYDVSGKTEASYYYDLIDINLETKEKYEDPLVGFYLAYNSTSGWYKNDIESMKNFIYKYNYIYQTNYKNLEDFLQKNNFQSLAELENYALSTLQEKEEGKSL